VGRLLHRFAMLISDLPAAGNAANAFKIGASENPHHAGHRRSRSGINGIDPRMRHIRAQEMHIGLTVQINIIGVIAGSRQEPDVLAPFWAGANASIFRHIQISSLEGAALGRTSWLCSLILAS